MRAILDDAPAWDIAGSARPLDGDGDGQAKFDIGCYESAAVVSAIAVTPIDPAAFLLTKATDPPDAMTFTVQNVGLSDISWALAQNQSWATLSSTGGTLPAGESTTIELTPNSSVCSMGEGIYPDTLHFTNLATGEGNTTRTVTLAIGSVYVNCNSGAVQDGRSWSTGFRTIQEGVDAAVPGQQVRVAAGTYAGVVNIANRVLLQGGYSGQREVRDPVQYPAVIKFPDSATIPIGTTYPETPLTITNDSPTVDGFMITDNYAAVTVDHGSGQLTNCSINATVLCRNTDQFLIANNQHIIAVV